MYKKMRFSLAVLVALAVFATLLSGCGRKALINVNGEKISKDVFYSRLEKVPVQTPQGMPQPAGGLVIEQLINEQLMLQFAKEMGVAPTDEQIEKKMEFVRKESGGNIKDVLARSGMTVDDLKNKIRVEQSYVNVVTKGINIPESEVKQAYEKALAAKPSPFIRPEAVRISAIICNSKERANKAYELLEKGTDFNTVAMKLSDGDPFVKQSRGNLGWMTRDMEKMPKNLADTVFSLEIGKYSKPILVQGQWVIVKAEQKRPKRIREYNEVKDMIREQLAVQKGAQKGDFNKKWVAFVKKADIKVNYEQYKNIPNLIKKKVEEGATAPAMAETVAPGVAPKK